MIAHRRGRMAEVESDGNLAKGASPEVITVIVTEHEGRRGRGQPEHGRIIETKELKLSPKSTINQLVQSFYETTRPVLAVVRNAAETGPNNGGALDNEATLEESGITEAGRLTIMKSPTNTGCKSNKK